MLVYKHAEATTCKKWYGTAYMDFATNQSICYPIPLNVIIKLIRQFYFFTLLNPARYFGLDEKEKQQILENKIKKRVLDTIYDKVVSRCPEHTAKKLILSAIFQELKHCRSYE